jgi:hypothetical protein
MKQKVSEAGKSMAFVKLISKRTFKSEISGIRRLGGVVVSLLATGCGFKTRPRRWIFKVDKNPQHTFLSDGK